MLIFLLLGTMHSISAQKNVRNNYLKIQTQDGNVYYGSIISENSEQLVFDAAEIGKVTLKKADIESKEQIEDNRIYKGKIFPNRLLSVNYFLTPNALSLKKGEVYYHNIYLFYNQVTVGLTDQFSIGVGAIPFGATDSGEVPIWVTPKLTFPLKHKKISLGIGAFILGVFGDSEGIYGLTYGNVTLGTEHANVSVGIGYTYHRKRSNNPVFSLSGMLRGKRNTYLVMDNFTFKVDGEYTTLLLFGGRTHMKKSIIDYGLMIPAISNAEGSFGFHALPWVGLMVPL